MKTAILGILLVLAMQTVSTPDGVGTGTIRGRVVASQSNKPLSYANVLLVGTTLGSMSLTDGKFEIKGVPAGTYTVKALMMGYASQEKDSVIVNAGDTTTVEFVLEPKAVAQMQEVIVTGERNMVEVSETKVTGRVSEQQLQEMPVDEVLEAVGLKSGIVKTGDDMHVRGGRSGEIQIQIDGVPVSDPLGGGTLGTLGSGIVSGGMDAERGESWRYRAMTGTERYEASTENAFLGVVDNPLSTFSIDVDRASYGNMRRFVRQGMLPPAASVRIEEFLNYFAYEYPSPDGDDPFAIHSEVAGCPWNSEHRLVRIGLQGKRIDPEKMPPSNLVFLIDVSGSMEPANKLPLIKAALPLLVMNLRKQDRVAIVVYAGTAAVWLVSTPGDRKRVILESIERLEAAGSTAGGAGIKRAYDIARANFIKGGNNRLILATDGDFNVGVTGDDELVRLVEEKRKAGVFLTVLGVGEGNLQDAKMEKLADHGNGNYAYLDDLLEAQKVLVHEMGGTLFTIAKDVKIQVEFNPARVTSYRLIGYENRMLAKEDFANDRKDAGELGSGHTVTALYEIEPAKDARASKTEELRYVNVGIKSEAYDREEIVTIRLRYKAPDGDTSKLIERTALDKGASFRDASIDFRFVCAVAELGLLLRTSEFKGKASFDHVIETAKASKGADSTGYRTEFVELAELCKEIAPQVSER